METVSCKLQIVHRKNAAKIAIIYKAVDLVPLNCANKAKYRWNVL